MQAMTGAIEVAMLQAEGAMMLEFRIVVQPCITGDEQKPMAELAGQQTLSLPA